MPPDIKVFLFCFFAWLHGSFCIESAPSERLGNVFFFLFFSQSSLFCNERAGISPFYLKRGHPILFVFSFVLFFLRLFNTNITCKQHWVSVTKFLSPVVVIGFFELISVVAVVSVLGVQSLVSVAGTLRLIMQAGQSGSALQQKHTLGLCVMWFVWHDKLLSRLRTKWELMN